MAGGMIGLACGEQARFSDVIPGIVGLDKPPGTLFMKASSLGPAEAFNAIAQSVIDRGLDWLFLINDDNLWPVDVIKRFLSYNVDVVGGFYLTRTLPCKPVAFDRLLKPHELPDGVPKTARYYHRFYPQPGQKGLQKIIATGDGCLLIRRHVLEAIPYPWWSYGETYVDRCDHDMVFSRKVVEAGFNLYLDLDTPIDHLAIAGIRPFQEADGTWWIRVVQAGGQRFIQIPFTEEK